MSIYSVPCCLLAQEIFLSLFVKKKKKIPVLMCIKKFPVKVRNATVVLFPHRLLI